MYTYIYCSVLCRELDLFIELNQKSDCNYTFAKTTDNKSMSFIDEKTETRSDCIEIPRSALYLGHYTIIYIYIYIWDTNSEMIVVYICIYIYIYIL